MAAEAPSEPATFERISRVRGALFRNVTRAAALVGVVVLVLLLLTTTLDAFRPFTADPEWYLLLSGTFAVPSLLATAYCWRRPAAAREARRAIGATLAGTALAALLVLWLGGGLGFVVLLAVVAPTAAFLAVLARRRRALTVGLQTAGIVAAGGGVATIGLIFVGAQATLVAAVAVGVPAALLARFFLNRPAAGARGVRGVGYALVGGLVAAAALAVAGVQGYQAGEETAAGVLALGAILGATAYAAVALRKHADGTVGLAAPYLLLAGALVGFLFHREFVVVAPVALVLYAVAAGLPALAFAVGVTRTADEGVLGVVLPLIPVAGAVAALSFHERFVVAGPTVLATFGLAIAGALGGYAAYVRRRDRSGQSGLLVPVVTGGGLLAGLLAARSLGIAGPETWLDVAFLTNGSHYDPALSGIHPALVGSLYLMFVVTFVAFPIGIGAAIYLEEYAPDNRFARFLEINIANLAGVPSVVYGLLGVAVFIRFGGLGLGAVLAGGLTLSLLILPIVIISAQEAIRSVPDSLRQASYGMGATRWQTVRNVVLPRSLPGILTGTILALGRAVGETAPLIMVGLAPIGGVPGGLTDQGTAMPLQVFAWALDARELFRENVAAAGSMTLLILLLSMNAVAIVIRNKYQREQ